jgi:uncharacterized Fe-S center protein
MEPTSHLAFFKSSSIGGTRANDEVGSVAQERPQMESVDARRHVDHHLQYQSSTYSNCNNNTMSHKLSVNVSNITNYLHP